MYQFRKKLVGATLEKPGSVTEKAEVSPAVVVDKVAIAKKFTLDAAEINALGSQAEGLVGGKNYNCAQMGKIPGIRYAGFRAVSANAFDYHVDNSLVNAKQLKEYIDNAIAEYNELLKKGEKDGEKASQPKFVLEKGLAYQKDFAPAQKGGEDVMTIREFISQYTGQVNEAVAASSGEIKVPYRVLQELSIAAQIAMLAVDMPEEIKNDIAASYQALCQEAGKENLCIAVRSSAIGEDGGDAAFAGAQDSYQNISGNDSVILHTQRDFASGFNIRSLEYRLSQIQKSIAKGNDKESALNGFGFDKIAVSVVLHQYIKTGVADGTGKAGTAFSIDPSTGMDSVVSIDANWGHGDSVVGGEATPDNYQVTKDEKLIVKNIKPKGVMILHDPATGKSEIETPENLKYAQTLTDQEILEVSRMIKNIEKHYGRYVDTEFAIDETGIYIVQIRPETNYNEWNVKHPGVIPMKRMEITKEALDGNPTKLLKGDGASKGAATGRVRFVEEITPDVVESFQNGDILVAERTDPDFLTLFKKAGAVIANVGGRTSHAAITSRELGIPAVIGVEDLEALKKMDGQIVTVDGSHGIVYEGELELEEVGEDIDTNQIRKDLPTDTSVGLILADVEGAKSLSKLQRIPDFKVGLLRAEFVLGSIGVHYKGLKAFDAGVFDAILDLAQADKLNDKIKEIERKVETIKEAHKLGMVPDIALTESEDLMFELVSVGRDKFASKDYMRRFDLLIKLVQTNALDSVIAELKKWKEEGQELSHEDKMLLRQVELGLDKYCSEPAVLKDLGVIEKILENREKVAYAIKSNGYKSGHEFYVEMLSQRVALFAKSFGDKDVIYRTTDYKSNEYEGLTSGELFEAKEDNPMLGYRGVSRGIDTWEMEAFKKARVENGAHNLHIMLPFVRKESEMLDIKSAMQAELAGEASKGLKTYVMAEIPSVAINPFAFLKYVDGFSIGSNDLTQGVLMTDRDAPRLQKTYDEEDPALIEAQLAIIFAALREGKEVGYCGMGVSNSPLLAAMVSIAGITSASVTPDAYVKTKQLIHSIEQQGLTVENLGEWLQNYTAERMKGALKELGQLGFYTADQGFSVDMSPEEAYRWLLTAKKMAHGSIASSPQSNQATRARASLKMLDTVTDAIIKANADYTEIVNKALHTARFSSAEEYAQMLDNKKAFEAKMDILQEVLPHTPEFNHSTTFRKKVEYLQNRRNKIDREIDYQSAKIKNMRVDSKELKEEEKKLQRLYTIRQLLLDMDQSITRWARRFGIN